ncbi:MAG: 3,4-dihydroxyphenylacetate 2,3-dioxygenase, partial [Symbiobacteriaceae bacterium]
MLDTRWACPPFDIVRAAHAELLVTDLERAREFYVDLLGFVVTEEDAGALYLRGYEERLHHSLVLRRAREPAVGHLAFRVADEADLEHLAAFFRSEGCPVRWLEAGEEPGQGRALRVQDPLGFPVEFFHAMEPAERLLQRFDRYVGAHIMRIDHFNLHVPDVQSAYDYYKRLGFRCSEYTATDPPDERLWAAWMYRKPNVHDVALMNGAGPRLHHVGFWVGDTHSVLRACDILAAANRADVIERGPGRHGLSNAFFVYLRDPDGHRIELY